MKSVLVNMIGNIMRDLERPSKTDFTRLRVIGRLNISNYDSVTHIIRTYVLYPVEDAVRLNVNDPLQKKVSY